MEMDRTDDLMFANDAIIWFAKRVFSITWLSIE